MKKYFIIFISICLILPNLAVCEDKSILNTTEDEQMIVLYATGGIIFLVMMKLIIFGEKDEHKRRGDGKHP